MNLMISLTGEREQLPFVPEIAALGAGIELGSYGLVGIRSERDWGSRLALHRAVRARFQGTLALHGPFLGMEFAHVDYLIRDAINHRLNMTFDAATELKASRVILHSGFTSETEIFNLHSAWLERSASFWRNEIRRWAAADITIALENDTETSPDWMVRLAEEVDHPALGLCLDIGHLHVFSELDAAEWVRRMEKRLIHVHRHDNDGTADKHWPIGRGMIDFESFYAAIMRDAPGAMISLEVEDGMEVKMENLRGLAARL